MAEADASASIASVRRVRQRTNMSKQANMLVERLQASCAQDDRDAQLAELVTSLKASDSLLAQCRALMKQESKRKAQRETLARGVTKLSNTPEYVMRSALQSIT
eukprot:10469183-Lingulodinium_polyedra.AAC.1